MLTFLYRLNHLRNCMTTKVFNYALEINVKYFKYIMCKVTVVLAIKAVK